MAAAYALGVPAGPAFSYAHPNGFHAIAASGFDTKTGLGTPAGIGGL